jgi:hypothetical protein
MTSGMARYNQNLYTSRLVQIVLKGWNQTIGMA